MKYRNHALPFKVIKVGGGVRLDLWGVCLAVPYIESLLSNV